MSFSHELTEPAFRPRAFIANKDARTLARDILELSVDEFSTHFKHSPMKRAKRRGLARNAAVVLGNMKNREDIPLLQRVLTHDEPMVHEHAQWALDAIAAANESSIIES